MPGATLKTYNCELERCNWKVEAKTMADCLGFYKIHVAAIRDVSYTEAVIADQVIAGLTDTEIQREVLSHTKADTCDLEKLLKYVEGKESGVKVKRMTSCILALTPSLLFNNDNLNNDMLVKTGPPPSCKKE